jgi:hypothetical protein
MMGNKLKKLRFFEFVVRLFLFLSVFPSVPTESGRDPAGGRATVIELPTRETNVASK